MIVPCMDLKEKANPMEKSKMGKEKKKEEAKN